MEEIHKIRIISILILEVSRVWGVYSIPVNYYRRQLQRHSAAKQNRFDADPEMKC